MPNARNKNISVVITPGAVPPFGLQHNHAHPPKQTVRFHNGGHPGVMVYFNILDGHNTDIEFQPVPDNALRVDNPPNGNQLVPLSVEQDGNQLIAYCRNLVKEQFKFTLRFRRPDGHGGWQDIDYDPIGDGNNGLRL
jgi:hypothetical protein